MKCVQQTVGGTVSTTLVNMALHVTGDVGYGISSYPYSDAVSELLWHVFRWVL